MCCSKKNFCPKQKTITPRRKLNGRSLKQNQNIPISSTLHRTLNTSRGIIRYRDEDLDNLSDEEICKELAPRGVIHVKRFITKRNGQLVKLNTFLITFNFPNILSSIRMGLYNVKVSPYVLNPIRCFKCQKFGHGKGQCKGKLKCFKCGDEDHEGSNCGNEITTQGNTVVLNIAEKLLAGH